MCKPDPRLDRHRRWLDRSGRPGRGERVLPRRHPQCREARPDRDPAGPAVSRRAGGDPVLLYRVAAAALVGGSLATATLTKLGHVNGPVVAGIVVLIAGLSVLAVSALLPEPRQPVQPAAPRPRRDDQGPGRPSPRQPAFPGRPSPPQPAPGQPAPTWPGVSTRANSGAGGNGTWTVPAPATPTTRWNPAPSSSSAPSSSPAPPSPPGPAPMSVAVPVPGSAWWKAASAGARTPEPPAVPAPDRAGAAAAGLSDYTPEAAATRVVQCPRCGDFGVDVRHQEPGFAFTCKSCAHHWRWGPGSAWPTTVVRPRLRRRPDSGGPESF